MILIYITCKNKTEAKKIAQKLIKARLIACANLWPIDSIYRWQGKIENDKEVVLLVKTKKENYQKVERLVKKLHSYETPCIVSWPITKGNKSYLRWLKDKLN